MAKDQPETNEVAAENVVVEAQAVPVAETAAPAAAPAPQISLDEFCRRLSVTDKRVELIGGFFKTEEAAGRVIGTRAEFAERYGKFINQPA